MDYLTRQQVIKLIRAELLTHGNQKKFAKAVVINESYLSDILMGRRNPNPAILRYLKLEQLLVYVPRPDEAESEE